MSIYLLLRRFLAVRTIGSALLLYAQAWAQLACATPTFITVQTSYEDVSAIFQAADESTLFVFDIDNTLIKTAEPALRSAPEYQQMLAEALIRLQKDYPYAATPEGYDLLWSIASRDCVRHLMEPDLRRIIENLEARGARALALSYFGTGKKGVLDRVEVWRFDELQRVGLNFANSFPELPEDHFFTEVSSKNGRYPVFYKGILGADHLPKAELLGAFLNWAYGALGYEPKKVVVVDDIEMHVRSILEFLQSKGIAGIGIHYAVGSSVTTPVDVQKLQAKLEFLAKNKQWTEEL